MYILKDEVTEKKNTIYFSSRDTLKFISQVEDTSQRERKRQHERHLHSKMKSIETINRRGNLYNMNPSNKDLASLSKLCKRTKPEKLQEKTRPSSAWRLGHTSTAYKDIIDEAKEANSDLRKRPQSAHVRFIRSKVEANHIPLHLRGNRKLRDTKHEHERSVYFGGGGVAKEAPQNKAYWLTEISVLVRTPLNDEQVQYRRFESEHEKNKRLKTKPDVAARLLLVPEMYRFSRDALLKCFESDSDDGLYISRYGFVNAMRRLGFKAKNARFLSSAYTSFDIYVQDRVEIKEISIFLLEIQNEGRKLGSLKIAERRAKLQ